MSIQVLLWIIFNLFVVAMLALDLGVFHRTAHVIHVREALAWCALWVTLALLFNLGIFCGLVQSQARVPHRLLVEYSLSVDNIFVFLMIFTYFRVPYLHQHKVLFWGILGALVMRALFILVGITLIRISLGHLHHGCFSDHHRHQNGYAEGRGHRTQPGAEAHPTLRAGDRGL